jgi:hypothetical protein
VATSLREPRDYAELRDLPGDEREKWFVATASELDSLLEKDVFVSCFRPPVKRLGTRWVYKIKRLADGTIERYKARLVAWGFTQRPGLDYGDTFAPTVHIEAIWMLAALACQNDWDAVQIDVKTAYQ